MDNNSIIIAAIDIGSNSVLLTIAKFFKTGKFKILDEDIAIPRLAKGITIKGAITKEALKKCISALNKFKRKCEKNEVSRILCTGTEVFRKASNALAVKKTILRKTGFDVKIISPQLEAMLSFLSATEEIALKTAKKSMVIDIGAGSTELVYLENSLRAKSVPIGALFIKDYFAVKYPLGEYQNIEIRDYVKQLFSKATNLRKKRNLVGVGGTITAASIFLGNAKHSSRRGIDFYRFNRKALDNLIKKLSKKNSFELKTMKGMPKGISDILLPGLILLSELMKLLKTSSLTVRNRGLRFGLLFSHVKKYYCKKQIKLITD